MPDVPVGPDAEAALRAANARLRQVIEAKDTEIAVLRMSHQAQLNALRAQVAVLSAEIADLCARLGQNPRNSSRPPSSEGAGQAGAEVAAYEERPQARPAERPAGRDPGDDRSPGPGGRA